MNFSLVDQVQELVSGKSIRAAKQVSMAEEYLADHFPGFPVLPGVMMLECAVETAAWLVRDHFHFACSLVVLKEARQIRYGNFVRPGQTLIVTAEVLRIEALESEFKIRGTVSADTAIQGRIALTHLNLADGDPALAAVDQKLISRQKALWATLFSGGCAYNLPTNTPPH